MAHYNLGNTLREIGNLQEAKKAFEKSLEIEPEKISRLSSLIHTLSAMCMWDEIEKYSPYLNRIGIEGKAIDALILMYIEDNPLNHLKRAIKYT